MKINESAFHLNKLRQLCTDLSTRIPYSKRHFKPFPSNLNLKHNFPKKYRLVQQSNFLSLNSSPFNYWAQYKWTPTKIFLNSPTFTQDSNKLIRSIGRSAQSKKKRNFVLFMMSIHQLIPKNWHKNKDCKKRTYKFKVYYRQLIKMKSFSFYPR